MSEQDDDISSETSSASPTPRNKTTATTTPEPANEIIEDLTSEIVAVQSDDESSEKALNIGEGPPVFKSRPYQLEMLEESMKRNIIVAMDTGSGKTQIAVLRILRELDTIPEHKLIWFLAPTVSLCSQQFEYLQRQITSVQIKFLSGIDEVDRWSTQSMWNAVLKNVKVVISTYQILLDALSNGFVRIESLSLIVFDEAHNCVGKHPGSKLMQNFYHRQKAKGLVLPHILGLTASPLMRSDPNSLNKIEETLNSICRTPTHHRAELRSLVNLPKLIQVRYQGIALDISLNKYTKTLSSLSEVLKNLKLSEDPYVISLLQDDNEKNRQKLSKVSLNQKTWCRNQITSLHMTSMKMACELGAWAADYYISLVVLNVQKKLFNQVDSISSTWDISGAERQYLGKALSKVEVMRTDHDFAADLPPISDKVAKLIQVLTEDEPVDFSGIIFVETRASTEVLAKLLSLHPATRDRFRIGTMVGTSISSHRTSNIVELADLDVQKHVLQKFRSGVINLVIATSVLEEGIDIPACNVVICFQKPANLKSFVQRRGRARHQESKLVLLFDSAGDTLIEYQALEQKMKEIYEDEMRTLSELVVLEDSEEEGVRTFCVESTGALLDLDNAVSRLYHFCSTLPASVYVDLRPEFVCTTEGSLTRATVTLPLSVNETVRTAKSRQSWQSEKNAIKDAAFEAYVALHKAGLVNEHLLPLMRHDEDAEELASSTVEKRSSFLMVNELYNPWIAISQAWENSTNADAFRRGLITVDDTDFEVYLPVEIPQVAPFELYWDVTSSLTVKTHASSSPVGEEDVSAASRETFALLTAGFGNRFRVAEKRQVIMFLPSGKTRLQNRVGSQPIYSAMELSSPGLVRDSLNLNIAFVYKDWIPSKPSFGEVQNPYDDYDSTPHDTAHLSLKRLPRRTDFLHKVPPANDVPSTKPYANVLPMQRCMMDVMPFKYVRFAMLVPSIIHRFGIHLIAQELSSTLLKDVGISDTSLVITAICTSNAEMDTNYQRLEFLGDSILKLCTSIQLMAEYPLWYEGLLSFKKDRFVSNSRLSRAAIEIGLDRFIIFKGFTGLKWRPLYVEDFVNVKQDSKRQLSSKIVADVVESLIGAAMVDGGFPKALACLRTVLPELDWQPLEARRDFLFQRAPELDLPLPLKPLEQLINYKFTKPSLLIEAFTHASSNSGTGSLERLEFLGDAILDNIIVSAMFPQNLPHMKMHLLRTALVNADFLAFMCMEWAIEQESTTLERTSINSGHQHQSHHQFNVLTNSTPWPLWRFMRHSSPILARTQHQTNMRHSSLRAEINTAIQSGTQFPWALLARLQAKKFYSDIIESLIAAVWIDSGSLSTCADLVERMGILPYLRRILKEDVQLLHPKEELGILADCETVRYVIRNRRVDGDGEVEFLCTVFVGGNEVVSVEGGVDRNEVRVKAAEEAVRVLKERGRWWLVEVKEEGEGDVDMSGVGDEDGGVDVGDMDVDVEIG